MKSSSPLGLCILDFRKNKLLYYLLRKTTKLYSLPKLSTIYHAYVPDAFVLFCLHHWSYS